MYTLGVTKGRGLGGRNVIHSLRQDRCKLPEKESWEGRFIRGPYWYAPKVEKMKRVALDQYIKDNRVSFTKIRLRMAKGRSPSKRGRDEEEKNILLRLDKARWEGWLESGRIEILGERKFRLKIGLTS